MKKPISMLLICTIFIVTFFSSNAFAWGRETPEITFMNLKFGSTFREVMDYLLEENGLNNVDDLLENNMLGGRIRKVESRKMYIVTLKNPLNLYDCDLNVDLCFLWPSEKNTNLNDSYFVRAVCSSMAFSDTSGEFFSYMENGRITDADIDSLIKATEGVKSESRSVYDKLLSGLNADYGEGKSFSGQYQWTKFMRLSLNGYRSYNMGIWMETENRSSSLGKSSTVYLYFGVTDKI